MGLPSEIIGSIIGGKKQYQIERSLRFNAADSAYLTRTLSASDTKKWTWSGWLKRSLVTNGGYQTFFGAGSNSSNFEDIRFNSSPDDNRLIYGRAVGNADVVRVSTNRLFRDFSAWYHIIVVYDSAQATSTDRVKFYINGIQETSLFETTYPTQNAVSFINGATAHNLGRTGVLATRYFGGYLTEIHFIDGQALTPSSFGETNPSTNTWIPKKYTGTYGTNGFYLPFSDNTSTTTLGDDFSGNNNDWTLNNFSVAAGSGNDSLEDTPTNNYCTLAPIFGMSGTLSNGNLSWVAGANNRCALGLWRMSAGKWYFEASGTSSGSCMIGVAVRASSDAPKPSAYQTLDGYSYSSGGTIYKNEATTEGSPPTYTAGDIIGVTYDCDAGEIKWYKNGVLAYTLSGLTANAGYWPVVGEAVNSSTAINCNFGQRPFAYTPPAGFKALNTKNLPAPIIKNPAKYMNATLWTGNGNTRSITGIGFQPDLVWTKSRSNAENHKLVDSVRTAGRALSTNLTADETIESGISSFDPDGFTIDGTTDAGYNTNTYTYVGWSWKKGTIPGFDIVTYTGNGTARTISHNLGAVPHLIVVKARTTASTDQGWPVYHRNNTTAPETDYLLLNSTAATADLDTVWNDTAPTSSVFSVGTNALVNTNNDTYVAYLWTEVPGFSRIGSYTGNGSADGPFVWCGFRPRWGLFRRTDVGNSWIVLDTSRSLANLTDDSLVPDLSNAEFANEASHAIDILCNGFKVRTPGTGTAVNASGGTYVFAAFAEFPFKYSPAR